MLGEMWWTRWNNDFTTTKNFLDRLTALLQLDLRHLSGLGGSSLYYISSISLSLSWDLGWDGKGQGAKDKGQKTRGKRQRMGIGEQEGYISINQPTILSKVD